MGDVRKLRNLPRLLQDLEELQEHGRDEDFQAALELALEALQERDEQLQLLMRRTIDACEKRKLKVSSL